MIPKEEKKRWEIAWISQVVHNLAQSPLSSNQKKNELRLSIVLGKLNVGKDFNCNKQSSKKEKLTMM